MTIQSDITTALASVASGRVYPDAAPQDAAMPFVVYRRTAFEPIMTLQGAATNARSTFVFEAYATTLAGALTLAASVVAALVAAFPGAWREAADGETYEPVIDAFMEPAVYSFWHTV